MSTFPCPLAQGPKRTNATYIGSTPENDSNQSSFSFTNVPIGSPGLIAFVIAADGTNGTSFVARTLSSLTVNGVAANIIAVTNPNNPTSVFIAYLRVASGTTANLIANFSGNMGRCVINVYRISGNKSDTPYDATASYAGAASSLGVTLTVPQGAAAIFGIMYSNGPGYTFTWAGAKEDYDTPSPTEYWCRSGASISPNNGVISRTVTATANGGADKMALSGVVWH